MRPGQEAPDEDVLLRARKALGLASMRPGQEAPDERQGIPGDGRDTECASMRPGQEAPDEPGHCSQHMPRTLHCFNEAGARSPG